MKAVKRNRVHAINAALWAALIMTGCSLGTGVQDDTGTAASAGRAGRGDQNVGQRMGTDRQPGEAPETHPLSDSNIPGRPLGAPDGRLADVHGLLTKPSIYYRYNDYTIEPRFQPLIEAYAKFLRDQPDLNVRVEGNCDERGSRAYNLALGQRRANFVKRALVLLGVHPTQISAVSLGAEKPRALGRSNAARGQNRRTDLVYMGVEPRK